MKTGIFSILSAMILFAVSSCVGPKEVEVHKLEGFALGTVWSVTIKGDMPDDMRDQIESLLTQADRSMSVFNPESTISKLNDNRSDRVA